MTHPDIASFLGTAAHWGLPPAAALLAAYMFLRLLRTRRRKRQRSGGDERLALENQEKAIKRVLARTEKQLL